MNIVWAVKQCEPENKGEFEINTIDDLIDRFEQLKDLHMATILEKYFDEAPVSTEQKREFDIANSRFNAFDQSAQLARKLKSNMVRGDK